MKKEIVQRLSTDGHQGRDRLHARAPEVGTHDHVEAFATLAARARRRRRRWPSAWSSRAAAADRQRPGHRAARPAPLAQSFRAAGRRAGRRAWIGYAVPVVDGERIDVLLQRRHHVDQRQRSARRHGLLRRCAGSSRRPTARRWRRAHAGGRRRRRRSSSKAPIRWSCSSGSSTAQVDRVRVFSEDCELDAGGREITWLNGVRPADSVALLEVAA